MRITRSLALIAIFAFTFASSQTLASPKARAASAHKSISKTSTSVDTQQRLVGGFWRLDHSFVPTLIVTNALENADLPITPVLYADDGTEYRLPSVTIAPSGVVSVDIRSAVEGAPSEIREHLSRFGSAAVVYTWGWAGAASAMVQNRDVKRSLNFNFELRNAPSPLHALSSISYEGLWWKESTRTTGFLGLTNVTHRSMNVAVRVVSEYGAFESERSIELRSNETRSLSFLDNLNGQSGGIRITFRGAENDLILAGGLEESRIGYSAQVPLSMVEPGKSSTISVSSVGLMLGKQDPKMQFPPATNFGIYFALRNVTEHPVTVNVNLYDMHTTNSNGSPLKSILLGPRRSQYWTAEDFAKEFNIPNDDMMVNLVFSYQGASSDVLMANGSIDQTKNFVFESNMKAVSQSEAKLLKDWDVSNGNDTMISLLNLDEDARDLLMTFFFDGGHYKYPLHLTAGGSTMINLSDIIAAAEPDSDGNKIPASTLHGTAILSGARGYPEWINVAVGVGVFNVATATCGNKCPTCFGYSTFKVQGNNATIPLNGTASFSALAFGQNNVWQDVSTFTNPNGSAIVSWSTSNSVVATSLGGGQFKGVASGSFTAGSHGTLIQLHADCAGTGSPCPTFPVSSSASGKVQKPGFLKVIGTPTTSMVCSNEACEEQIQYQVMDTTGTTPMAIPNMAVLESMSYTSSCGSGTLTDSDTWATNAGGYLQGVDHLHICPNAFNNGTCLITETQTFTVNGFPVLIMASNGVTTGAKNIIKISFNNGVSACPIVQITP